jgi:hypothetical protein
MALHFGHKAKPWRCLSAMFFEGLGRQRTCRICRLRWQILPFTAPGGPGYPPGGPKAEEYGGKCNTIRTLPFS